jgi:hypothetical protein
MVLVRGAAVALIASGLMLGGCGSLPGLGGGSRAETSAQTGIGVNAYLWRATLDTLSFMPLINADPWGGVVNYGWYIDPQTPNERFKATVFILDRRLRADALNVSITKQVMRPGCMPNPADADADVDSAGCWAGARVAAQTETDLENAILTKARQLNLSDARR